MGPCVVNRMNQVVVVAEALMADKTIENCVFVMKATFEMAVVLSTNIKIISCDSMFLTDCILNDLGISDSCNLIIDRHHLMEVDWCNHFGTFQFGCMEKPLKKIMIQGMKKSMMNCQKQSKSKHLQSNTAALTGKFMAKGNTL